MENPENLERIPIVGENAPLTNDGLLPMPSGTEASTNSGGMAKHHPSAIYTLIPLSGYYMRFPIINLLLQEPLPAP